MPYSAHITDVIIKAGSSAQNTLWLDWRKTPITFLVGLYLFVFFPPLILKTLQHSGMI